ncbi:MAG: glycosyltransferase family 2 protein [Candidatus Cloacimonetes bacterium]|jgi:cellulose synthase/poly-beta-1,6-N-acetylglucosamine synthase-like glycosyltransferase|nr:glycosyltransferase [Candidatus Cloacimonadota bacterium]MDD2506373.1 glycosyltransferase family 2 protein [Candidatus Cloacimonadota bacterium]MDD4147757.1 glycosyltransferase family 2 protein [Candidatus Cloacimonadota bacterium]MDD4560059.1 glycosyltransferase family 2 protein [Candidatus Cloacimonadota bacterium]
MKISCSIGVFAHNEEANILHLLKALHQQKLNQAEIKEIIVVSSASTDKTDDLVRQYALNHSDVTLYTQPKREGKSNAINLFIEHSSEPILVVISGDVIPAEHTIELLVSAFDDPDVGASGGRPMPINSDRNFIGYCVNLLWRMHHRMALISPKLGEMIAFRRLMKSIPRESAVDEASIEAIVKQHGLHLRYIPQAEIINKGPETFRDFVKQRRRIQNGHLWLMKHQNYQVISQDKATLFTILKEEMAERPTEILRLAGAVILEVFCRLLGSWDFYIKGKNPFAWDISTSTKKLKA